MAFAHSESAIIWTIDELLAYKHVNVLMCFMENT